MGDKKKTIISAHVGKNEISLSNELTDAIYKELINELGDQFEEADIELVIEISHVTTSQEVPLSDFNQKLKKALEFNPKDKRE